MVKRNPRLRSRIDKILNEMSHDFSLRTVRFVGYFLTKIVKSIYKSILVNDRLVVNSSFNHFDSGWSSSLSQTVNKLSEECPILYVPTHRSYADFLLFSFVCFSLDMPLPSIAAGIDFLGLNQIASLMRSCGAFFIRRSFKHSSDALYWHVFRAYLQNQIRGGERPLEFFIEGTRSRSGKSLYPRTGLLSVALELFFTGQIPDLLIIPVSISYDRLMEEGLYSKELLPSTDFKGKPAETPRHLMTGAKAILKQNFGSVYFRFCQPISLREQSDAYQLRLCHTLDSKCDLNSRQTPQEINFVVNLSKSIIKAQQMNAVFSPFTFASLIFLSYFEASEENDCSVPIKSLLLDIQALSSLLNATNLSFSGQSLETQLYQSFEVHSNIVILSEDKLSVTFKTKDPSIRVMFQQYANQSMQLLIDIAIFVYSRRDFDKFEQIKWILSREFIYMPSETSDSYILAQFLSRTALTERAAKVLHFQVDYYVKNYKLIIEFLEHFISSHSSPIDMKSLVKAIQKDLILTSDLIQNCLVILSESGALVRHSNSIEVNVLNLNQVSLKLSQFSDIACNTTLNCSNNFKLKANL